MSGLRIKYLKGSDLDRRVTLVSITTTRGSAGSAKPTRSPYAVNVPAKFDPVGGSEKIASGQILAEFDARFYLRWRNDIKVKDELVFDGRIYEVIGPPCEIGRRDFIEVLAKVRGAA
jgi:SPP1 family predicted phage head-tail adaptor